MRRAMPYPCSGPIAASVFSTIKSSVPCRISDRSAAIDSPVAYAQEYALYSCGMSTGIDAGAAEMASHIYAPGTKKHDRIRPFSGGLPFCCYALTCRGVGQPGSAPSLGAGTPAPTVPTIPSPLLCLHQLGEPAFRSKLIPTKRKPSHSGTVVAQQRACFYEMILRARKFWRPLPFAPEPKPRRFLHGHSA